jgi:hypothetical protein
MPDHLLRSQFSLHFFWFFCTFVCFHHSCCDVNVLYIIMYIIIPPQSVFRFMFISFGYSEYIYSFLLNVSHHLLSHIIRILTFVPLPFRNNFILKHLRNASFELLSLRSYDFYVSISPDVYLKMKSSHQKFMLCDDTLARYNLTIHAVWSLLPSSHDKIDLSRVLTTIESN